MNKDVILTIGAPGSGKSTWAAECVKEKGIKTIVLNRDDLRAMLFGGEYKYSRNNEAIVFNSLVNSLKYALCDNTTQRIIIADTNLNESTRDKLYNVCINEAKDTNHDIKLSYKLFEVSWQELVKRNKTRGKKSVPMDVLRSMHKKMLEYTDKQKTYIPNESLQKAVIFDIDGTLADNNHRNAFEYWKCDKDAPISHIIDMAKLYSDAGYAIICVSGRNAGSKRDPREYWVKTSEWLTNNNVPWDTLHMRGHDDFRKDDIVKEEIFWNKIAERYNVKFAVDDRDQVVEMWRRIGVKCLQCDFGDF